MSEEKKKSGHLRGAVGPSGVAVGARLHHLPTSRFVYNPRQKEVFYTLNEVISATVKT